MPPCGGETDVKLILFIYLQIAAYHIVLKSRGDAAGGMEGDMSPNLIDFFTLLFFTCYFSFLHALSPHLSYLDVALA